LCLVCLYLTACRFRWVVCQLAELRKCLKPAGIRNELQNLPKTLSATYSRILDKVPSMYQAEMLTILMLLAFSKRPMSIQEVAEAAAVDLETGSFSTDGRFATPFDILELCSSLVTLTEAVQPPGMYYYDGPKPEDARQLQFAHFSVKEYLISEKGQQLVPAPFRFGEPLAQSCITQISLIYLLDFKDGQKITRDDHRDFPFLEYAALYWTKHLSQLQETHRNSIESLLLRLFDPQNETRLFNVLNVHNPARINSLGAQWGGGISRGSISINRGDFQPPLYYASHFGLLPIVHFLLSGLKEDGASRQEVLAAALYGSASGGEADITQLLLDSGADPSSQLAGDVLFAAASGGSLPVVEILLAAGAPICAPDAYDGSALHQACRMGHAPVVRVLMDYGFDPYSKCHRTGTALSSAIMEGHHDVVAALVTSGVDVNRPPDGYYNALAQACQHTGIDTVRLLLEHGAVVSLKSPTSMALPAAAHRADVELMQLLLDYGADINCSSDSFYGTPLKGAIASRVPEALDFVLRKNADINLRGERLEYPIDVAIFSGNLAAADRLLEMGAKFGDLALEQSLDHRKKEYLLKRLLEREADPNTPHSK
jgi:ankyrin repeat protein